MQNEELKVLRACYELMRKMEVDFAISGVFKEQDLLKIAALLKSFESSDSLELQKISAIPEHLFPQMKIQHFINFMLPIERLLKKSVADDDFLIQTQDRVDAQIEKSNIVFLLENMRSAFNVGSIFRLADCLNIQAIYLCGYTATPANPMVQKTSLGSHDVVCWKHFEVLATALAYVRNEGYCPIALETAVHSKKLFEFSFPQKSAFILGNERFGLGADILSQSDHVLSIPTYGRKNSLNVANAISIASYEWKRQWS